ncbi:HNH endonuclease [Okeania sp. SIO2G5]|uniref:HNH endonuclease n=1 Tax=Okeania sp. SIO2G5 TaxID=2607796 RepID=UPI0013BFB230|nr:HNH endonuclease signature motif containing protein [Okeania sp. SIO2G5]NEP76611.1 HNH endonuclease [Okeania sp. SIO2G5]
MPRRSIPETIQAAVRLKAKSLCEYCHASEEWQYVRFTIDHVTPIDQGGQNDLNNLALACFNCNRRKWNKQMATDPESGKTVPLFNPRRDDWAKHFVWSSDTTRIIGLTSTGRATVEALALNRQRVIDIRNADKQIGRHPPNNDPIIDN